MPSSRSFDKRFSMALNLDGEIKTVDLQLAHMTSIVFDFARMWNFTLLCKSAQQQRNNVYMSAPACLLLAPVYVRVCVCI